MGEKFLIFYYNERKEGNVVSEKNCVGCSVQEISFSYAMLNFTAKSLEGQLWVLVVYNVFTETFVLTCNKAADI